MKDNMCFIGYIETWCSTDELGKLRGVEVDLIKENYAQVAESRGIDAGHKAIQIFTDSSELKIRESRKDSACPSRRWAIPIRERLRGLETKGKPFEAGQRGEAGDHHLR